MAAIVPKRLCWATSPLLLLVSLTTHSRAQDRQTELRGEVARIATALSASNPADALVPFSKSCPNYEKLRTYFAGLTDSYSVVNEADVADEEDSTTESKLIVNWSMSLNGKADEPGHQRSAEIHFRFVREKNKWKIVEVSPLNFFDPTAQ